MGILFIFFFFSSLQPWDVVRKNNTCLHFDSSFAGEFRWFDVYCDFHASSNDDYCSQNVQLHLDRQLQYLCQLEMSKRPLKRIITVSFQEGTR